MLVYNEIATRNVIKATDFQEASHCYVLTASLTLTAEDLAGGLSHVIENVPAGSDPKSEPKLFNVYKIMSCTGHAAGDVVFLKKVGYSNGTKVVEYAEDWSEEDAQQISVTTSTTVAITDLE